jgi:hypothetical protein
MNQFTVYYNLFNSHVEVIPVQNQILKKFNNWGSYEDFDIPEPHKIDAARILLGAIKGLVLRRCRIIFMRLQLRVTKCEYGIKAK